MMTMNLSTAVETERLILRRFREGDLQDLHDYLSNPSVVAYEPYKPMTLEEVRENLNWRISSEEMIAVEHRSTGRLIGNLYLAQLEDNAAELGYVFSEAYWHQGFARESCEKLLELAFASGIHRITAQCDPENISSWKLLERLGFTRTEHLRRNVFFWRDADGNPIWKDTYVYTLSKAARDNEPLMKLP